MESTSMWNYLLLSDAIQQIRIDLPGHGKSEKIVSYNIADMAEAVLEVINYLGLEAYSLVGHSMGGYVSLELMDKDTRVNKVVMLNSNFWEDPPEKIKDRHRVAKIVFKAKDIFIYEAIPNLFMNPEAKDAQVKSLIEEARQMTSEAIAETSLAMAKRKDHSELIMANPDDFLIIQGAEDTIVPKQTMLEKINNMDPHYLELPGCGHMGHIEATDTVLQAIEDFVK